MEAKAQLRYARLAAFKGRLVANQIRGLPVARAVGVLTFSSLLAAEPTLPEARRQGIGAALTLAACRDACALGYRVGVLGSSEMGFGVYQKIGFREYCKLSAYVWKPETEQEE